MNRTPHRALALDALRTFEAVARLLSFSAAADELHLTQPAVSRQIKSLEEELGASLFHRATRRVELTSAGQALLRVVAPSLARIDTAVRQIRMSRSREMVSVTTFPSMASLWLMPRLTDFERSHPGADIRIAATDRLVETDDFELDVALRHCRPEKAPAGSERLFPELLTPVIGAALHQAIARGEAPPLRSPADLAQHTLIEMDDGTPPSIALGWGAWLGAEQLGHLAPRRWITLNFTHQQVQAALAGHGVALARLALVHEMLARGDLVEPFGPTHRHQVPWLYWLVPLAGAGEPPRPEVRAFMAWVRAQAALTRVAIGDVPDAEADALPD